MRQEIFTHTRAFTIARARLDANEIRAILLISVTNALINALVLRKLDELADGLDYHLIFFQRLSGLSDAKDLREWTYNHIIIHIIICFEISAIKSFYRASVIQNRINIQFPLQFT